MPRRARCILPDVPYHITQRGVDGRATFSDDQDRITYLKLLKQHLPDTAVKLLGWCLMPNHTHLIAVPGREDSLAVLLRRVQGRYAQYYNTRTTRIGHLWQNRFYACALGRSHLWTALAYVENNPVRAGMVAAPQHYLWSSAMAHLTGDDPAALLDMQFWRDYGGAESWVKLLACEGRQYYQELQRCTYAGRPFGDASFLRELSARFGRQWKPGRPPKALGTAAGSLQPSLFPQKPGADQADQVF